MRSLPSFQHLGIAGLNPMSGAGHGGAVSVTYHTVFKWRQRYDDFPQPLVERGGESVWCLSDVLAWSAARKRWTRRPKSLTPVADSFQRATRVG